MAMGEQAKQNGRKEQTEGLHNRDRGTYVRVQCGEDSPRRAQGKLQKNHTSVWLLRWVRFGYNKCDEGKYIDKGNYAQVYECIRKDNGERRAVKVLEKERLKTMKNGKVPLSLYEGICV